MPSQPIHFSTKCIKITWFLHQSPSSTGPAKKAALEGGYWLCLWKSRQTNEADGSERLCLSHQQTGTKGTWLEMLQGYRPRAVPLLLSLRMGIKKCIWAASPRSAPPVVRVECLASALLMWKPFHSLMLAKSWNRLWQTMKAGKMELRRYWQNQMINSEGRLIWIFHKLSFISSGCLSLFLSGALSWFFSVAPLGNKMDTDILAKCIRLPNTKEHQRPRILKTDFDKQKFLTVN